MTSSTAKRVLLLAVLAFVAACSDGTTPADPGSPQFSRDGQGRGPAQLAAWFDRASPEALAVAGAVYADHDEVNGRLVFGVEHAAAAQGVRTALSRLGIPSDAFTIVETQPIVQVATLRDRHRPTQGGIQIHFSQYLCTMGFNVSHAGGRSFITNSHCTAKQGGTEGTTYYQPTSSIDPTVIGTEVDDPDYFRGGACPRGRKCRYSDAARALYESVVSSNQGDIAKTTGANNGSIDIAGVFSVTAQDNSTSKFTIGTTVNKVGRTTGWSQGNITNTCVNTNVSGTNITQLCQTFVSATVGSGDSGSPVFQITSGDNVTLLGILWGGSSDGSTFVFSPLSQVQQELGSVTATK